MITIKTNVKIKFDSNAFEDAINDAISNSKFDLTCPNCHYTFSVSGSSFGGYVVCPSCKEQILIDNSKLKRDVHNSIKSSLK